MRNGRSSSFIRIDAGMIIPGRGQPIENGSLISSEGTIAFVGLTKELIPEYKRLSGLSAVNVPVLMPGMWDCHVHFMGVEKTSIDDMAMVPPALSGARSTKDIAATLNGGFTSVRELSGYGIELSNAVNESWLQEPNIYSANSILSQTSGHGDAHSVPVDVLDDKVRHGLPFQVCDGVDECVKAVRLQIRRGAKVIKVATSGGVSSLIDDPQTQQFSDRELKAIVEEATRARRIVAACSRQGWYYGCSTCRLPDDRAWELPGRRSYRPYATTTSSAGSYTFHPGVRRPEPRSVQQRCLRKIDQSQRSSQSLMPWR